MTGIASYLIKNDDETLDKLEYFGLSYANLMEAGVTDADALRKVTQAFLDTLPTLSTNPLPKTPESPVSDTYFHVFHKSMNKQSALFPDSYNSHRDAEAALVRNYYDQKRGGGVEHFLSLFDIREFKRPNVTIQGITFTRERPKRYEIIFKQTQRRSHHYTNTYARYEDAQAVLDHAYPAVAAHQRTPEDRWSNLYEIRSI